ncbi:MAG TPA: hypothetical protein VKO18_00975 [Terriglobia bacterium]|nr:hypothetical protein [Terriglobia bacterium]
MKQKIFTATVYLCASAAVAYSCWGALWKDQYGIPPFSSLLFVAPAALLVVVYIQWLRRPEVGKKRRVLAAVVNFGVAAALLAYLVLVTIPGEIPKYSLVFDVLLILIGPTTFALASLAIFSRSRSTYAVLSLIAFIVWTYLACVVVRPGFQDLFLFTSGVIAPLIFAVAIVATFYRPRFSFTMGAGAGLIAAWWLLSEERLLASWGGNSWIALNLPSVARNDESLLFAKIRILAFGLVVVAIVISVMRLLPASWTVRKRPINERTWPAIAICFITLSVWYVGAAAPYRIPYIVDAFEPDLTILHVEKCGLQFHESAVSVYRDSRFYISRNNRRLFQYQFEESAARGVIPDNIRQLAFEVAQSPQLEDIQTPLARPLRTWDAVGWYVRTPQSHVLAFTSEYRTAPPREIVDLFHELEASSSTGEWKKYPMKDVCLGFCYDPLAGLGFLYSNQRCRTDENGKTWCR